MGGTNIFTSRGGTNIFTHGGEDKQFYIVGGQTFYVLGSGCHDDVDVDEKMYVSKVNILVSKVNILVSKVSKFSAGATKLGAHRALKF